MRTKCLVFIMSALLLLGLTPTVSGEWQEDPCGDALLQDKDLYKAKVEVFPDPDFPDEEPWIYLCLKMCEGCTMPGIVVWEFDVDHNGITGTEISLTGVPISPCPCKTCVGFDIAIWKAYRDQGSDSTMSWCLGCFGIGGAQCATRGASATCDQGTCYELDQMCYAGVGCYLLTEECTGCAGVNPPYYPLDEPCPSKSCAMPRLRGEWYAKLAGDSWNLLYGPKVDWGRDMPKPPEAGTGEKYCEKLPWGEIVRKAHAKLLELIDAGEILPEEVFDLEFALANPPLWQVSTYFDPAFVDQDDFISWPMPASLDITDWMPNGDCNKASGKESDGGLCHKYQRLLHCCLDQMACQNNEDYDECKLYTDQGTCEDNGCYWNADKSACQLSICMSDSNFDGKVSGADLGVLKKEYGRRDCACQPGY